MKTSVIIIIALLLLIFSNSYSQMMYGDSSRIGVPFSKDPHVIRFMNKYLMYYSIPPYADKENPIKGWGIGIAQSEDLKNWNRIGEITPKGDYEKKGLCAPCALVIKDTVHLFYQTYGNGREDAICHAKSIDGIRFTRNPTNPIFRPQGDWTCGRAIDAEVIKLKNRYMLYFATRDTSMSIQMLGVAATIKGTSFNKNNWEQLTDYPILKPELPWEQKCVEGASVILRNNNVYMFYAGAYNNKPQQIGIAKSKDGVTWTRLSNKPFLSNGNINDWNSSESGHPHIFNDIDGKTYLFYQGNNDGGKTWFISIIEVEWNEDGPFLHED